VIGMAAQGHEDNLTIVFAALAVSRGIETEPVGASRNSSAPIRPYRTVTTQAGRQTLIAAQPLSDDLAEALTNIRSGGAH
jgi:hypothetical protein